MNKYGWLFILLFTFSCSNKKTSLSDNKSVDASDFFGAFQKLTLPYNAADTNLARIGDTTTISLDVLNQFVPDTAFFVLKLKPGEKVIIHPVGKIENKNELYLLAVVKSGKTSGLYTFLFNSKKKFISQLPLVSNQPKDDYMHSVDINTEPTFTITKDKTVNGQHSYTKNGYAYNNTSKSFIEVVNETNENPKKNKDIMNPIDTLEKTFRYSGDYVKDKTNFISVRDGSITGRYSFFLHFEKNKNDCNGELKGTLTMTDATKAIFQQSGDPCVIDFIFSNHLVQVKERGSCGNHRGITCLFDDSYRKKEGNPKSLKNKKK